MISGTGHSSGKQLSKHRHVSSSNACQPQAASSKAGRNTQHAVLRVRRALPCFQHNKNRIWAGLWHLPEHYPGTTGPTRYLFRYTYQLVLKQDKVWNSQVTSYKQTDTSASHRRGHRTAQHAEWSSSCVNNFIGEPTKPTWLGSSFTAFTYCFRSTINFLFYISTKLFLGKTN